LDARESIVLKADRITLTTINPITATINARTTLSGVILESEAGVLRLKLSSNAIHPDRWHGVVDISAPSRDSAQAPEQGQLTSKQVYRGGK
jgi:hypothetical protein